MRRRNGSLGDAPTAGVTEDVRGDCWNRFGDVKGTIRNGPRYHFAPNDVRRHRLISICYISLLLSRQRPRVRVPSSPPFIPKELGEFCRNHRGREKGALRALFVPPFSSGYEAVPSCPAMCDPPPGLEEKTSDTTAA
jgi:hypothetical protein